MSEAVVELKNSDLDPTPNYEGINYFREIDERFITIDTDKRSHPGAETVQFDPNSGELIYLKTVKEGPFLNRTVLSHNLRSGEHLSTFNPDLKHLEDHGLQRAKDILGPPYSNWFDHPPGFHENKFVIEEVKKGVPIPVELMTQIVDPGDRVLFYDRMGLLVACQVAELIPSNGGCRVFVEGEKSESIIIYDYDYHSKIKKTDGARTSIGLILPGSHEDALNKREGIWKISEAEFEQLHLHSIAPTDVSVEYPLSREEFVIAASFDGMAFDRWGASINQICSANPGRYEAVTKANLNQAISNLVDRFGEQAFAGALRWITLQHLYRLHTPHHRTMMPRVQNNIFGDVHSDILGFKKSVTDMARQAIRGAHPVALDMQKDGHGKIGQGVYNAKTIPGDVEFMSILKEQYPSVFQNIVHYIEKLPPLDQKDWYGNSTVYPLRAMREFFPEAYALMQEYLQENDTVDQPGIIYSEE